ncbi:MAG: hypothetical protein R3E39_00870 [Anaerolineae bacterium]
MNSQPGYCPLTGTKGKKVDGATVKSMLSISLRTVQDVQYYFCRYSDCNVVYFSDDGQQLFYVNDIRELVYQKEPDNPDVPICYCFRHTPKDVRHELETTGKADIIADIEAGIQAGQCACDWRNPQGDCCLGNVRQLIKHLSKSS